MILKSCEFDGKRALLYSSVLYKFPKVRHEEVEHNLNLFKPLESEKILEIGSGSGFYTVPLANKVTSRGEVVATDPSEDQLKSIPINNHSSIRVIKSGAHQLLENDELIKEKNSFDGIWSHGSFHHCFDKTQAFYNFSKLLKPQGRIFICDILSGSKFARYFDYEVAKYSITGHEVSFLTEEFFDSLCFLFQFEKPKFHHVDFRWNFDSIDDMTIFMRDLHGLSIPYEKVLESIKKFFKIENKGSSVTLYIPHTIFETKKI